MTLIFSSFLCSEPIRSKSRSPSPSKSGMSEIWIWSRSPASINCRKSVVGTKSWYKRGPGSDIPPRPAQVRNATQSVLKGGPAVIERAALPRSRGGTIS